MEKQALHLLGPCNGPDNGWTAGGQPGGFIFWGANPVPGGGQPLLSDPDSMYQGLVLLEAHLCRGYRIIYLHDPLLVTVLPAQVCVVGHVGFPFG